MIICFDTSPQPLNFKNIANNNEGVHVNQITARVSEHGYRAGDIKNAINNLSNEGHIYPTFENHFQYTGCVDDAVLQVIKTLGCKLYL